MKINFAQVLQAMNGDPMQEIQEGKPNRDMTLGRACINVLLTDLPAERQTGTQKFDRFKLAMKIGNEDDPVEVTAEAVALIKERLGLVYGTYLVGVAWTILEGGK